MIDEQRDFPAAHSMDTGWFAVDDAGHIAILDSGEDGAVPKAVVGQEAGWDLVASLAANAPELLWRSARGRHGHQAAGDGALRFGVVLFLKSVPAADPAADDWSKPHVGRPIATDDGDVFPVYFGSIDDEQYTRFHDAGTCLGCGCHDEGSVAHLGLFGFRCHDYGLQPYRRTGAPAKPLQLADLPAELRQLVRQVPLPGAAFDRMDQLQPLEHVPCNTWGSRDHYVGADGQIKPLAPDADQAGDGAASTNAAPPPAPAKPKSPPWWKFWKR